MLSFNSFQSIRGRFANTATPGRRRLGAWLVLASAGATPIVLPAQQQTPVTITFEDAVRLALKQSVAVRQAENTLESSEATIRQRSAAFLPNFSLSSNTSESYGYTFNQNEGRIVNQSVTNVSLNASSQVSLYDGGRTLNQLRESRLTSEANEADLTRAKQTAVFNAASGFLTLIQRVEQAKVQQDNLAMQLAQDSVIKRMVRAGARPISDQYQQEATVASAQYSLVTAQRDLELARIALIRTLQLDPRGNYSFATAELSDSIPSVHFNLDSLLDKALGSRSDLEALDTRLDATDFSVKNAGGSRMPQLSMNLGYGTAFNTASPLSFNDQVNQRRSGNLGVSVSMPIFDRRVASVAIQQARISAENARLSVQDRQQSIATEVREAYLNHEAAIQQFDAARAQYAAAELAANTQARRYEVGAGTLVEVTTARAQLVQAASAVVTAKYSLAFQQSVMSYYVGDMSADASAFQALAGAFSR